MGILRSVWTYVAIGVLAGILLSTVVHQRFPGAEWIVKLGDALVIAALVGGLLHVREVSVLFETLARKTLIQEEYLTKLGAEQLRRIRSLSLRLTVEKAVNNPDHRWRDLESTIEAHVFSKYLPDEREPKIGLYRSDYDEAIGLAFKGLRQALADNRLPIPEQGEASAQLDLVELRKHTTLTTFEILAARRDIEIEFSYPMVFITGEVPFFPDGHRVKAWVGEDEESAAEIDLGDPKRESGLLEFRKEIPLKVKGSRRVWVKTEEWHNADDPRFILNTMSFLTKGLSLSVSSDRPLRYGGGVFGIGRELPPKIVEHGISLRYDSWLLEDNGYIIWWDKP